MSKVLGKHAIDFRRDILAIVFLAVGIFLGLCLLSYSPTDPALNAASNVKGVGNLGGIIGAYTADILFTVFGISAYLASILCLVMSGLQLSGRPVNLRLREIVFYCGTVAFAATLIHLRFENFQMMGRSIPGGGIVGGLIGNILSGYLNRAGAYVIAASGFLLMFVLATKLSLVSMLKGAQVITVFVVVNLWKAVKWTVMRGPFVAFSSVKKIFIIIRGVVQGLIEKRLIVSKGPKIHIAETMTQKTSPAPEQSKRKTKIDGDVISIEPIRPVRGGLAVPAQENTGVSAQTTTESSTEAVQAQTTQALTAAGTTAAAGPKILKRADARLKRITDEQLKFRNMDLAGYAPPPISLLDAEERNKIEVDEDTLKKNSLLLEKKLMDFDVAGKVTAIHPGPVITMYEFEPAAGTKLNKIVNLQDDLSLALSGRSVRIVPHLPGKAAVGIEVPNHDREIVWLKDMISSTQFARQQSKLPLVLGSSTSGHPIIMDITKMPHLLIAGATGSGKSVAINAIVISILYRSTPADVRFIMVDPKMLELSIYDGIPHMLLPVVTKPKPVVKALRWAIKEMERRYGLMADTGTRNIVGYNEKIEKGFIGIVTPEKAAEMLMVDPEAAAHTGKIPYIVIVIDEMADLMMIAGQDMEEAVTRLAQMARAAGIHLIMATQRPSVDVITGLIKANFPARIAFKVTAKHDSRTILDGNGAETLLGQGDMLFMTPQGGNLIRIHGPYVTDSDISRVVSHIKEQGKPIYEESILREDESEGAGFDDFDEEDDELYDKAVRLVAETKQASISMVQRKLRIGYNRAARMIERMEAEGVIGPADGSKPRQVLAGSLD